MNGLIFYVAMGFLLVLAVGVLIMIKAGHKKGEREVLSSLFAGTGFTVNDSESRWCINQVYLYGTGYRQPSLDDVVLHHLGSGRDVRSSLVFKRDVKGDKMLMVLTDKGDLSLSDYSELVK